MLKLHHKRSIIIPAAIVALAIVGGGLYWYSAMENNSSEDNSPDKSQDSSNKSDDKKEDQSSTKDNGAITSKDSSDTSSPSTPTTPSVQPAKPIGTFVSNHYPNLSGKPAPNTESSTCSTTVGVQCQIRFTKGNTTKYLPAKNTDKNGNVSWSWTLQSAGLSAGTWKVSAVATSGDKTAVTYDALNLVVAP